MATRPYFMPRHDAVGIVRKDSPGFKWFGGFALSQQQKCIEAHHAAITSVESDVRVLEISSKSMQPEGMQLSAFNLTLTRPEGVCKIESVFQASKVFVGGIGPHQDLYAHDSMEVRDRVKQVGAGRALEAFEMDGVRWPLLPRTAFYDWLYLNALREHADLGDALMNYTAFTDIKFNPKKSLNCQAASAALYVSLRRAGKFDEAMAGAESFLRFFK